MDQALVRFRKAAARENRDRDHVRRRYSSRLQDQAVEYWRARHRRGEGLRDVAAALGVAPWSLHRWIRAYRERERFQEVQVVAAASRLAGAAPVVLWGAEGLRVEGLDVDAVAQLLRLLR
jgi:hypothetical protein